MTSKKRKPQEDILSPLLKSPLWDEFYSKQPLTDQEKEKINRDASAKTRLDIEQYNLKILERRRQAVEKLSGIDLARRLKLYDDFESVFRKMKDLLKQWSDEDAEDFPCEWDSVINEYKSLLQREKLYANVGQQTDQKGQNSGGNAGETSGGKIDSRSIDSQNKHEDIVELKPNFCGIGLNINALIRKREWGTKIKNLLKVFIYRK
jgi:hypothetical protein